MTSRNNRSGMSRFESLKQVIKHQIMDMAKNHPNRKVGLVTFTDKVQVVGDASLPEGVLMDEPLDYQEALEKALYKLDEGPATIHHNVEDSEIKLLKYLDSTGPNGCTALGPAVYSAAYMAAKGKPGSQVVICTDGMANRGLGSFGGWGNN